MYFSGIVALLALSAIVPLRAQSSRPSLGSLSGSTSTGSRTMDPSAGITLPGDAGRIVSLMGKVMLEGGEALDGPVRIERVCGGAVHAEGFTDPNGNFSITLGQEQTAMPDASEAASRSTLNPGAPSRGMSQSQLATCELRASLAGYRSDAISLAERRSLDNPNIGTIFLHRLSNVEGLTISATTALAPKEARKAYQKGLEAERRNKPDEALKEFEKSVAIYPKFAAAWFQAGTIYEQRDQPDQARNAYAQSIAADAKYLHPYERLYMMAYRAGNWQDAADWSDRMLRLDPFDYPEAYSYNAIANLRLNRLDAAEKSAREAVKLDAGHRDAKANYTLGYILAQEGSFEEAARYMRACLEIEPEGKQADTVRKQLGEIELAARAQAQKH